jgi:tRNA (adenine57-N1/adenine58-N1)-methyltransferase
MSVDHTSSYQRSGPFHEGDRVQLSDDKGKLYSITLKSGDQWHSHKGWLNHDDIIGRDEGSLIETNSGTKYQALRPLLTDYVLSMPRGATIVYPKDAALILGFGDIAPGVRVLEAGAGSGALSISLLRAIGESGSLVSYEAREEFLTIAEKNVKNYFGAIPKTWELHLGDVRDCALTNSFDRIVLDMLAPWDCVELAAKVLKPGGVFISYVATTTQLSRVAEALKDHGSFTEPESFESLIRGWHHEGLAVRPKHQMNAHTAFLLFSRKVASENGALKRRRRPAKGAYEENVTEQR